MPMHIISDSEDDCDGNDGNPYTTWGVNTPRARGHTLRSKSTISLRMRIFGSVSSYATPRGHNKVKPICTTPGQLCAGETETEVDEPVSI